MKSIKFSKMSSKMKKIKKFEGTVESVREVSKYLNELGESKTLVRSMESLADVMHTTGIKSMDELDKITDIKTLEKQFDSMADVITDPKFEKLLIKDKKLLAGVDTDSLTEFNKGQAKYLEVIEEFNVVKKDKTILKDSTSLREITKRGMALIGGVAGGVVGSNYNGYSNQYVDIMTQEQYYRLCGTQTFDKSN